MGRCLEQARQYHADVRLAFSGPKSKKTPADRSRGQVYHSPQWMWGRGGVIPPSAFSGLHALWHPSVDPRLLLWRDTAHLLGGWIIEQGLKDGILLSLLGFGEAFEG